MIHFAAAYDKGPIAIRYPRGQISTEIAVADWKPFTAGKVKIISEGTNIAILTLGDMIKTGKKIEENLKQQNISTTLVNLLSIKPLDVNSIEEIISKNDHFMTLENGIISGGVGEYILSNINTKYIEKLLFNAGFPDEFITHGSNDELFKKYSLDAESLSNKIIAALKDSDLKNAI